MKPKTTRKGLFTLLFVIVMLSLFSASAEALQYEACPAASMIDNAWWNPSICDGGIYAPGSLYFKWEDFPFANSTIDVRSITLEITAKSPGTNMQMLVWNGYSWTALSAGWMDFLGNYKYDLTNIPGPYMDGNVRLKIINTGPKDLQIQSIKLSAVFYSKIRTLTVVVRDCQTEDPVSGVDIKTGDETLKTGGNGKAAFPLPKDQYYRIEASNEDYYDYTTSVYLDADKETEFCMLKKEKHDARISGLDADDDVIRFYLKNTGNAKDTIYYNLMVGKTVIASDYYALDASDTERVDNYHTFLPGIYSIEAAAFIGGQEKDSQTITHCVSGMTEKYRCSGKFVQRQSIDSGCDTDWENVKECSEGCTNGQCVSESQQPDGDSCQVRISSISVSDKTWVGAQASANVAIANTGSSKAAAEATLFIDGIYAAKKSIAIDAGKTAAVIFQFSIRNPGKHMLKINTSACGKVKDSLAEEITAVQPSGGPSPPAPKPPATAQISVEVSPPDEVKTWKCGNAVFGVAVSTTVPGTYNIDVKGIDQSWVDYPAELNVKGQETFYVYASPQEDGEYTIYITVSGQGAPPKTVVVTVSASEENRAKPGSGALAGMLLAGASSWGWIVLLFILLALALLAFLRSTGTFGQQEYDFRMLEYDRGVRKAALS